MSETQVVPAEDLDTTQGQAGGSPSGETEGTTQVDGGSDQTQDTGAGEGQETVSRSDEASVLRERLREREEQVRSLAETLDRIDADPEASKEARRALEGRAAEKSGNDPVRDLILKRFSKLDKETVGREDGPWVETMTELAKAVREDTLREVEQRVGRRLQELDRQVSGNRFEQALEANGIDREVQSTPEFKSFMRDQARTDKRLGKLRNELPEVGGEMVALRWTTREARRATNGAERQRIDMARGGRLNSGSTRGGASSKTSPAIDRYDPQRAEKLVDLMFRKNVKPEDIDFNRP